MQRKDIPTGQRNTTATMLFVILLIGLLLGLFIRSVDAAEKNATTETLSFSSATVYSEHIISRSNQ